MRSSEGPGDIGKDTGSRRDGPRGLLRHEIRWSAIVAPVVAHPVGFLLGLGVVLRVAQYLSGRGFWLDEESLAENILDKSFAGLFGPLANAQLAPPGFLALEWLIGRLPGDARWTLRIVPLAAGVVSLFLFESVARRSLNPTAALVALATFVLSDDLIYYASELKQYSSDVAIALGCASMGIALTNGPATPRQLLGFAAAGAAAVWISHPALFVLASVGVVAFSGAVGRRRWGRAAGLALVGAAWLASFAGVYAVSFRQLGGSDGMWRFWAGAFPPVAGSVAGYLGWTVRKAIYLFVNPLCFATPLGPRISALPALVLFVIGCISLVRRDARGLAMLLLPIGFAVAAAAMKMYPTHGRLALFLVPFLLVPIAEGAGWLRARGVRGVAWAMVLAAILFFPALDAACGLAVPRGRGELNPYGDRRPVSLDPARFPF